MVLGIVVFAFSVRYFVDQATPSSSSWRYNWSWYSNGADNPLAIFRLILLIPHIIIVAILGIAVAIIWFIVQWVILFVARFPEGMHKFVAQWMGWATRVAAYSNGLTDRYPPFSLETIESGAPRAAAGPAAGAPLAPPPPLPPRPRRRPRRPPAASGSTTASRPRARARNARPSCRRRRPREGQEQPPAAPGGEPGETAPEPPGGEPGETPPEPPAGARRRRPRRHRRRRLRRSRSDLISRRREPEGGRRTLPGACPSGYKEKPLRGASLSSGH